MESALEAVGLARVVRVVHHARERILGRVGLNAKAPHDRFQLAEVLFDLQRDLPKVARGGSARAMRLASRVPATPAA